jgi:hypothetical protein
MTVDAILLVDPLARVKIWFRFEPLAGCISEPHLEARRNEKHNDAGATKHR